MSLGLTRQKKASCLSFYIAQIIISFENGVSFSFMNTANSWEAGGLEQASHRALTPTSIRKVHPYLSVLHARFCLEQEIPCFKKSLKASDLIIYQWL